MEPPCREADRESVKCPDCERSVQMRWLRYGHVCGRTFNVQQRAVEEIARAEQQFRERVEPAPLERAAPRESNVKDWSQFLSNAF
jgi:hypothetical protein